MHAGRGRRGRSDGVLARLKLASQSNTMGERGRRGALGVGPRNRGFPGPQARGPGHGATGQAWLGPSASPSRRTLAGACTSRGGSLKIVAKGLGWAPIGRFSPEAPVEWAVKDASVGSHDPGPFRE